MLAFSHTDDPFSERREQMVTADLIGRRIRDPNVLRAMLLTPRHLFVPASMRSMAYEDGPLAIGYGATISQPYVVALMTESVSLEPRHRVLEIGTGSGYQAAILGQLAGQVYTIEIVPQLAESAARTLCELGYANVHVRHGDGYKGWKEHAPYDRIVVTAAPLEVPRELIVELARGGRLVAPVGAAGSQELVLIDKRFDGRIERLRMGFVNFVPMKPGAR